MKNLNTKLPSLAVALLLSLFPYKITAQNLILNGGFETATAGLPGGSSLPLFPAMLDNWSAVNVDGELIYDLTLAHNGTGFMSMLQNTGANLSAAPWLGSGSSGGYDKAVQIAPVSPATTYELQVWVRSGDNLRYSGYDAGTALIQVEQFTPTPALLDTFMVYTPLVWQQSTFYFTTGPACTSVAVLFSVMDGTDADAWFDDVDLHLNEKSGINNASAGNLVSVYPTLITDKVNINTTLTGEMTFIVFDCISKKVTEQTFSHSLSVSTQNFSKGVYFYEIKNNDGIVSKGKLIKAT